MTLSLSTQPVVLEIMASLRQRYAGLNRHYEAASTECFVHLRCYHQHETLIDAAKCAAKQGMPGWYVFAVEFDSPRQLTATEESLVNESGSVHTSPGSSATRLFHGGGYTVTGGRMLFHRVRIFGAAACALSLMACGERPKGASFRVAPCELVMASAVEKTHCAFVTSAFLQEAKPQPLIGRAFLSDEYRAGAPSVVLLSYAVWQRRFGADPAIVGRDLQFNGRSHTVVGILPKSFDIPSSVDAWTPEPDAPK